MQIQAAQLPNLTSLVLHDIPKLSSLGGRLSTQEMFHPGRELAGLSALVPSLRRLSLTGTRISDCRPSAVSSLSNLTRLVVELRQAHAARPGTLDYGPCTSPLGLDGDARGRHGPSPLAGCGALRELVIRDAGARLAIPQDALRGMTALQVRRQCPCLGCLAANMG